MAVTKFLEYSIYLTNKATVDAAQALYPGGIRMAPDLAATTYAAPLQIESTAFSAPCTRSPWFVVAGSDNYPTDVAIFTRKSGGWFGLSFLFGTTTAYRWVGKFVYVTSATPEIAGVAREVVAIAQRKAFMGFEAQGIDGEIVSSNSATSYSRDASRHTDGYGYAQRSHPTSNGPQLTMTAGGAAANAKTWERIYFRIRQAPTSVTGMWRMTVAGGAAGGAAVKMTASRTLAFFNFNGATDVLQSTGTDVYEVNRWYRLDLVTECKNPGGNIRAYVGRKLIATVVMPAGVGIAQAGVTHTTSVLGDTTALSSETFECDYDDWIASEWPTTDSGGVVFTGLDWLNGSKVQRIASTAFGAGNVWTGDYRYANQENSLIGDVSAVVTSSTAGAALVLDVDAAPLTKTPGALGAVALFLHADITQTGAIAGAAATMGWRFNGLLDLAAISPVLVGNTRGYRHRMYRPSGLTVPIASLTPLEIHLIKQGTANACTVNRYDLTAELIGTFGTEDVPEDTAEVSSPTSIPHRTGAHMAPYPRTPWATQVTPPIAPVIIHSGTYVGNATAQELTFRTAPTWLLIKREAVNLGGGVFWWTSQMGAHKSGENQNTPAVYALIDPAYAPTGVEDTQEQQYKVRIVGSHAELNAAAITYQYIAFCDPGGRYSLNGALHHDVAQANPTANALINPTFTPEWVFGQMDRIGVADATFAFYAKGPGHATNTGSLLTSAQAASTATLSAGSIGSGTVWHPASAAQALTFASFRNDDGSSDANKLKVLRLGTYTGDGSASRTITFSPTGLRPLYAMVVPSTTAAIHRTPSNTGTISNSLSGGGQNAATGITAGGIDSMVVGSALNTNAVVYSYFVLLGSATAGNNGWSIDGEFAQVDPDNPVDGYTADTSIDPITGVPTVDPDPDPGTDSDDDCLAGTVCVTATTRVVNEALLEIGSTKILSNYCTQTTIEAQVARVLYEPSVRAVLHAFPWPFATKYAALTLAATQPTNQDWAFSYRQPTDCVFERRLSVARSGAVNPTPPPYELSSDDSGGLIFSNEVSPTLEYTMRPPCVAFTGDALFREALKWHLAAAMAPPVTRMADKAKFCREQYDLCIDKANAIIRPGDPGLRTAPTYQTTDAACMTANIEAANLALIKIGAATVANLTTDQSREAMAVNLIFEHELRSTLRDHPWKFAKRYDEALVLVGGTDEVAVNPDWQFSYRLPTDYVMVRRLVTEGTGRSFDPDPTTFEVGSDATGALLFTGEDEPLLEYTARITCCLTRADVLFMEAFAWRLAAALAPTLAQFDPERQEQIGRGPEHPPMNDQRMSAKANKAAMRERVARFAFTMYLRAIEKARVQDANEAQPEKDGDAEWIRERD